MARVISDFLDKGPVAFFIHAVYESEDGYNYYGFMSRGGQSYIMRENISTSQIDYTNGGYRLADIDDRATLTYTDITRL
jgi:hypothetical protein